ncbi:MAG: hypothetical protein JO000_02460, partial [Alphaproteobacteria bacterium]|nr:hypothetical protein [Alphaproteobacteria bacterium]
MRRFLSALLVVALLPAVAVAAAAPTRLPDQPSKENILAWINTYRMHPAPERLPTAVRAMSRLGLIADPEGSGVYVGFIAGVLSANPERADALVAKMFPLPSEHHWAIVRAIAFSDRPDWRILMQRVGDRMPERHVMMDRYLSGKLPRLSEAPIEKDETWGERMRAQFAFGKPKKDKKDSFALTPDLLDTLWGYYFATGNYQPLSRIVLMLRWAKERDSVEKLTLGSMAKYTLAINASRSIDLLARLKWAETQDQPDGVKSALTEVIDAAETVETVKLRNEALAAIDELKRRGPGTKRDLTLWGQVGEGALAAGCIAAAVAGQVELGIPCVIGGAAGSAA